MLGGDFSGVHLSESATYAMLSESETLHIGRCAFMG